MSSKEIIAFTRDLDPRELRSALAERAEAESSNIFFDRVGLSRDFQRGGVTVHIKADLLDPPSGDFSGPETLDVFLDLNFIRRVRPYMTPWGLSFECRRMFADRLMLTVRLAFAEPFELDPL